MYGLLLPIVAVQNPRSSRNHKRFSSNTGICSCSKSAVQPQRSGQAYQAYRYCSCSKSAVQPQLYYCLVAEGSIVAVQNPRSSRNSDGGVQCAGGIVAVQNPRSTAATVRNPRSRNARAMVVDCSCSKSAVQPQLQLRGPKRGVIVAVQNPRSSRNHPPCRPADPPDCSCSKSAVQPQRVWQSGPPCAPL